MYFYPRKFIIPKKCKNMPHKDLRKLLPPPLSPKPLHKKICKKFIFGSFFIFLIVPPLIHASSSKKFDDIPKNFALQTQLDWALRNKIFAPKSDTTFGLREAITKSELEKALTVLRCSPRNPYRLGSMEGRPDHQHVKKSELARELSFIITANRPRKADQTIDLPNGWEKITWQDIKPTQKHYQAAQILSTLQVIDYRQGYFGYPQENQTDPGDPDPGVLREQMLLWLGRSFHLGQCNFKILLDRDHDGVENEADRCPTIPGNTEKTGCPPIYTIPEEKRSLLTPQFASRPGLEKNKLHFWSGIEIKIGDVFFAAVVDPVTRKIISRSHYRRVKE